MKTDLKKFERVSEFITNSTVLKNEFKFDQGQILAYAKVEYFDDLNDDGKFLMDDEIKEIVNQPDFQGVNVLKGEFIFNTL